MSPNSSSTCCAGMPTRSATLRTISPCPFLGRDRCFGELYAMRPPYAIINRLGALRKP